MFFWNVLSLSFIIIGLTFIWGDEDVHQIYIMGVQCNSSEKYILRNISCFAKSYSRTVSTTNFIIHAKKPLKDLFVKEHASEHRFQVCQFFRNHFR